MSSSDGGSANPAYLALGGSPMPNLPIAGQGAGVDPYNYGKFQSFLPDVPSQADFDKGARAPSALGLTKEMFTYRGPNGQTDPDPAPAATIDYSGQLNDLRGQLAQLLSQRQSGYWGGYQPTQPTAEVVQGYGGGAPGGVGASGEGSY